MDGAGSVVLGVCGGGTGSATGDITAGMSSVRTGLDGGRLGLGRRVERTGVAAADVDVADVDAEAASALTVAVPSKAALGGAADVFAVGADGDEAPQLSVTGAAPDAAGGIISAASAGVGRGWPVGSRISTWCAV